MFVSDLKPNQAVDVIELEIVSIGDVKEFTTFRGQGRVANAKVKDSTGECTLTLWNDEAEKYQGGQKIRITNGWAKEYRGEMQVSAGKYGKIEIVGEGGGGGGEEPAEKPAKKKSPSKAPAKKNPKKESDSEEEEVAENTDEDIFSEAEKDPYLKYEERYGKE